MDEASKSTNRRKNLIDGRWENRWMVGKLLDVGCGNDPIKAEDWPKVTGVVPYDVILGHKDAGFLPEIGNESFDVVYSSHCLEHLANPRAALTNWVRVLRPGGFVVCTIPEEYLYENGLWPSRFNSDHKVSWTMRALPIIPMSINLLHLLWKLPVDVEHVSLLSANWNPDKRGTDQTMFSDAECAIEFVARKPDPSRPW